jgi:hypothetical protein
MLRTPHRPSGHLPWPCSAVAEPVKPCLRPAAGWQDRRRLDRATAEQGGPRRSASCRRSTVWLFQFEKERPRWVRGCVRCPWPPLRSAQPAAPGLAAWAGVGAVLVAVGGIPGGCAAGVACAWFLPATAFRCRWWPASPRPGRGAGTPALLGMEASGRSCGAGVSMCCQVLCFALQSCEKS